MIIQLNHFFLISTSLKLFRGFHPAFIRIHDKKIKFMQMISSSLHGTFFHIFNGLMPFAVFKPTFLLLEAEDFGFLLPTDFPFVLLVNPSLERIVLSLETIFRSVLSTLMLMLAVVPKSISVPFFCIKLVHHWLMLVV